jgi:methyl-accepting chemotaxis protein
MTIRLKLLACISLLTATIVAISAFSFYATEKESALANSIVADRVLPMEQLKLIADSYAVSIVDTAHKVRSGALTPSQGASNVKLALANIEKHWKEYIATTLTDEERGIADHFAQMRQTADKGVLELQVLLEKNDMQGLAAFADTRLYPTVDPLGADIAKLIDLQIRVAKGNLEEGNASKSFLTTFMIVLVMIAAAVAAFSIWTVIAGVIRPVNSITGAMDQLAKGNLDVSIYGEGRRDEIGAMASTVAVFQDNARERRRLAEQVEANRLLTEKKSGWNASAFRRKRPRKCTLPSIASVTRSANSQKAS